MSQVASKSLLLSQPKAGQTEVPQILTLAHTSSLTEQATEIKVEIPGVDPATVEVTFEGSNITVRCPRGQLTLPVSQTVDTSKIKADVLWGILTLTIPHPAPPATHNIKVSIHDTAKRTSTKFTDEG